MDTHSQIAIRFARADIRNSGTDRRAPTSHNANVSDGTDQEDKNGGPNHLRAWMRYREMKGQQVADALGGSVTAGMVSDLANSKRALSAKWLRRLAVVLRTTPGHLLDHDPNDLPTGLAEIWFNANPVQRRQLVALAKVVVPDRTGTDN